LAVAEHVVHVFGADCNSLFVNLFAPRGGLTFRLDCSPALGASGLDFARPGEGAREHRRRTGRRDTLAPVVVHGGRRGCGGGTWFPPSCRGHECVEVGGDPEKPVRVVPLGRNPRLDRERREASVRMVHDQVAHIHNLLVEVVQERLGVRGRKRPQTARFASGLLPDHRSQEQKTPEQKSAAESWDELLN